jgi:hypothetical protein
MKIAFQRLRKIKGLFDRNKSLGIIAAFIFISLSAQSQSGHYFNPITGYNRFMTGLGIPVKDSFNFLSGDTAIFYMGRDSVLYYKYKGYHKKVGSGSASGTDSASYHTSTASADSSTIILGKPSGDISNFVFDGNIAGGSGGGSGWGLTGNSSTVDGTNFIGTTDNIPFNIRVNNEKAGRIDVSTAGNTFFGYQSGNVNSGNNYNTGIGYQALFSNTTGVNNTANGYQALFSNTTGVNNTANGYQALFSNTTANSNTANGYQALFSNTEGFSNTAIGGSALYSNTTGVYNTAIGKSVLISNTTGLYNTAIGHEAMLLNTTGNANTANGYQTLTSNTTGNYNTASGLNALYHNTTGGSNTASGYRALYSNSIGGNNVGTGYYSGTYELGSNSYYVNNIDQSTTANDKAYSLLYGQFSGTALSLTGQQLTVNGALNVNGATILKAGTATAGTAPQKFTSGVNLTTPENGAVEYDGTNYWVTSGGIRYLLSRSTTGTAAPITTPAAVGLEFIDTVNKKIYKSTGTTSSSDWTILN